LKAGVTRMLDGFESAEIETGETTIFARRGGSGPPLLLLHFFPEAVPGKCAAALEGFFSDP
jgi:hypothetical protein